MPEHQSHPQSTSQAPATSTEHQPHPQSTNGIQRAPTTSIEHQPHPQNTSHTLHPTPYTLHLFSTSDPTGPNGVSLPLHTYIFGLQFQRRLSLGRGCATIGGGFLVPTFAFRPWPGHPLAHALLCAGSIALPEAGATVPTTCDNHTG